MWFSAAIAISTIITLASIFTVYKVFLDKPATTQPPTVTRQVSPSPGADAITSTPTASSSLKPTVSKISATPKPSDKKITLLQNNTALSPSASPSPNTTSQTISGTINLIGSAPSGSSLVIAARPTGSGEQFKVVLDGITAQNNAGWSWGQAQDGVRYDLFAVLKGKSGSIDIDYASSPSSTVKAPYQGQVFVVDVGYSISKPTGTITVECKTRGNNNIWESKVKFPIVTGAKMYHLQIGTTSGANDVVEAKVDAQEVSAMLKDSVGYYAQYAVASVSYPTSYQFSSFSTPQTVKCP